MVSTNLVAIRFIAALKSDAMDENAICIRIISSFSGRLHTKSWLLRRGAFSEARAPSNPKELAHESRKGRAIGRQPEYGGSPIPDPVLVGPTEDDRKSHSSIEEWPMAQEFAIQSGVERGSIGHGRPESGPRRPNTLWGDPTTIPCVPKIRPTR